MSSSEDESSIQLYTFNDTIVKDFGDTGRPEISQSVRTRHDNHSKRSKSVRHDDERERFSEDYMGIPENFRSLPEMKDAQNAHWSRGDFHADDENYDTFPAHVRHSRGFGASKSTVNLHRLVSADHLPLIFNRKITSDEVQSFDKPDLQRAGTLPNQREEEGFFRKLEKRHILDSFRTSDDSGQEAIEMWHTDVLPDEPFTHWRHIKRQFMDFEEFVKLALQTPHIRESRMRSVLVEDFMARVKETFSICPRQGERTLHGILRCDAQGPHGGKSVNVTATWICFPYLSTGDDYQDGVTTTASKGLYRTRTLFQWSYEREPASEREERQVFLKEAKKLLYVPQVWILLLGKDTIITSSPCSVEQLLPEVVKLRPVPIEPHRLQLIKLIGPFDREAVVPATDCKTFCELSISITDVCFDGHDWEDTYDLFIKDDLLTADLWLYFTESVKSSILVVRIRAKQYGSRINTISTFPGRARINEDADAEIHSSASESHSESAWAHAPGSDTGSETTADAKMGNEHIQSAHVHVKNGRQKDTVVRAPKVRPETEETTQKALSQVRPFLEWELKGNYSVIDLSSQAKEEATALWLLTNIHGRLGKPGHFSPAIEGFPPELNDGYLGSRLYVESAIEALSEIDGLEEIENGGRIAPMDFQSCKSNAINDDSKLRPTRSETKQQLKKGREVDPRVRLTLEIFQSTKQLIALFVPCSENHILLQKVWGALKALANTTANPDPEHRHRLKQMKKWTVLGTHDSIMATRSIYNIPSPDRHPFDVCRACERSSAYESSEEAVHHLLREHYYKTELTEETTNSLSLLVQSVEEAWMTAVQKAHCEVLEIALERLDSLLKVILKVRIGLAQNINDSPPAYTLPRTLIQVMEHIVWFILVCNRTARFIDSAYASWVPVSFEATETPTVEDYMDYVENFGMITEDLFTQACDDIYFMVRDTMPSPPKVCKSVGMRYMTANMLQHLLIRPLSGDRSTVELYVDIFSGLQYRVLNDRPHRRLFSRIHLLQEEVSALIKVRRTQQSVLKDLRVAFDPQTFHTAMGPTETSQCQSSMFILNAALKTTLWDIRELRWILRQSLDLERRVKHRVEILEESHGKAIFVFTLVTAIFLPLSFMTSYMGMNTADIREMRATQERFWLVAVPVTAMVMATAAFLAYKGHLAKGWLLSMPEWLDKSKIKTTGASRGRQDVQTVTKQKSTAVSLFGGVKRWRGDGGKNVGQSNQSPV